MKLLKMELHNFRGIKHFVFESNGKNCTVKGRNGTGKTSLYDALCWLLFGKDSRGQVDFSVKSLNESGAVVGHGLDHSVECVFSLDGIWGRTDTVTLKRVLTEKWVKARGRADAEFSGHTVSYFIDGVPKKEREFKDYINSICDEEKFRLLTNPLRFAEEEKRGGIGWKKRREILHELHPVTNQKVIDSDPELRPLTEILGNKTPDEYREICKTRQADIVGTKPNQEGLPLFRPKIDELTQSLATLPDSSVRELIPVFYAEIGKLQEKENSIKNGGAIADLSRDLAGVEQKIIEAETLERQAVNKKIIGASGILDNLLREERLQDNELVSLDGKMCRATELQQSLNHEKTDLLAKFTTRRKEAQPDICDKCGQPLPDNSLAEWNRLRSEDLLIINRKIAEVNQKILNSTASIAAAEEEKRGIIRQKEEIVRKLIIEKKEVETLRTIEILPPPELIDQRLQLQAKIDSFRDGNIAALAEMQAKIDAKRADLATAQQQVAALDKAEETKARIEELKAQEKILAREYDRLERHLFLLDEFTRAKVRLTEQPINGLFKMAQFKMFDPQINGALNDCCGVTYKGVPFTSDLNSGHRILVGCDIIATLQKHYEFAPVLFIDNAETLTEPLPEMDCQIIRLVADEKFDKLEIQI